ncbi:MAG TPA: tRNA (adenosine(37)-N6)-threonylcarbamoyltransferase complex ATPase subunit type 1 TsaE [Bacteroidales bacterium]|nr:tRNA (adenosine(37)-N6)-threonylcarbamoyltransferase complex ATPase subunit type 1 TsaE [Bacteroidales bacterium]HOK98811.1 tRNA (adenosine(37)-N6)-threonylcarbamoyltransferase complex ATPase subunit type 1 TsaE [Bacteroidales bacterium]HPO65353.1 tRNA (adenosine(37)-N6)-threonylcarbamoyltransferase complex ATPase subunit type 1 TsaE [Bacteroidales bacterium]
MLAKTFIIQQANELTKVAEEIISMLHRYPVITFSGKLGSGKTALIKEICRLLQVKDTVTSPTFTLLNEYETVTGQPVYHFDFYRVNKPEEIYDLGYEEYLFSGHFCFIEWPEMAENILLPDVLKVTIELDNHKRRHINIIEPK